MIPAARGGGRRTAAAGRLGAVLAGLIGAVAFAAVCGVRPLDPGDLGWLTQGDPAQYLLGWSFFRESPWTLPPGANPSFGIEIASSVFFSDSIPLFALLFKALSPLVEVQQYFGWWLLLCFVLQGVAGWLLMGLAVRNAAARLLGAVLLCFAPPLLWRLHGHYSLAAHWLVLLALWLAVAPPLGRRWWPFAWGGLLCAAALVHAYLLAMVAALWASDLARRALAAAAGAGGGRRFAFARLAAEALVAPGAVALCLWAAGFFMVRGGLSPGGFGVYAMNALAPLDPDGQWSRLLPDLPDAAGREAGSNFLGLGLLGLLAAGFAAWVSRPGLLRVGPERAPLLLALAGLAALALSHRVAVGGAERLVLPLPARALEAANALRASERMFWPVFYALAVLGVALVARRWGGRAAAALLGAAVVAQVADGSAGWPPLRAKLDPPGAGRVWQPLRGPFWDEAARSYGRVRAFPTANKAEGWEAVGRWASANGLPTDMVYLARVDQAALERTRMAGERSFLEGRFEPRTLYVLGGSWAVFLAASAMDPAADLLAEADGLRVFAPGWKRLSAAVPAGVREFGAEEVLPVAAPGVALRFGSAAPAGDRAALLRGWSVPEPHGHWNDGAEATLALRFALPAAWLDEALDLWVKGAGFLVPQRPEQRVTVSAVRGGGGARGEEACGEASAEWLLAGAEGPAAPAWRSVAVPPACAAGGAGSGLLRVRFRFPDAVSPRDIGLSADRRDLAFAVAELVLLRRGEGPP
ncbi:hypothetical protein GCM10009416_25240 [Craurococcus roseus]|uniref:Uncharacterized protein n=1 Tax=Craurococcus roseus TaxID=77585 RepID=A0ABN1F9L4_9PROT